MEADHTVLAVTVAGASRERDLERQRVVARDRCLASGLSLPLAVTPGELRSACVESRIPFTTALLLTAGGESAVEGLRLLEAFHGILPCIVEWIDIGDVENIVQLRKSGMLLHDESMSGLDATAAHAFAAGHAIAETLFGYAWGDNHRLIPADPVDCELIRFVYQTYAGSNLSRADICHLLNAQRIFTPGGARVWESKALGPILCDIRYAGSIRFGRWVRDDCHPPLITMELFETAQARLDSQSARSSRTHCRPVCGFNSKEATLP